MIDVAIADEQSLVRPDHRRLEDAVRMILQDESISNAQISVAVVDDRTIGRLHRKYLAVDDPTDVLSFVLERKREFLEGEVIVSAETACAAAPRFGWPAEDELLLYVIHGVLHLTGYDDGTPEEQTEIRAREEACLARFGLRGRYRELESDPPASSAPQTAGKGGKRIP